MHHDADLKMRPINSWVASLAVIAASVLAGCEEKCPPGLLKQGGRCARAQDASVDAGAETLVGGGAGAGGQGTAATGTTTQAVSRSGSGGTGGSIDITNAGTGTTAAGAGGKSTTTGADAASGGAGAQAGHSGSIAGSSSSGSAGTSGSSGSSCKPNPETCDGQDNDCDDEIDEDVIEMPCGSSMEGVCRLGKKACTGGRWGDCVGAIEPGPEVCDAESLDENCDGTSNEHCACTPGQTRGCGMSGGICRKGTQTCTNQGTWAATCEGAVMPEPEMCDGIDTDCDGSPDNGPVCPAGQVCADGRCGCRDGDMKDCQVPNGVGPCANGKQICRGGQWGQCASATGPEIETCDGIDNDCNGHVDDNNPCPDNRACLQNGTRWACAMCSPATVANDCPMQVVCKKPSCNTVSGACEYLPVEELWPCARTGALEGFCRSGSCQAPGTPTGNRLNPGEALLPGKKLVNGPYSLTCQADGKLVMSHTDGSSEITDWTSGSSGNAAECVMQPDGNLVIYGAQMNVIWASNTEKAGTYVGNYLLLGQNSLKIMSSAGDVVLSLK